MIRPEDLRVYFASNPDFLPNRTDDWLVELYSVLENVPAAFSKTRNETNMLTSSIIKTTAGTFVAPYRRADSRQLVPNVFLQSEKIRSDDIHFVDPVLYQRCRHFFDDILQIQKPNEYEFYIKELNRRYAENNSFDAETHIWDVQALLKCLKSEEYRVEANRIAKDHFMLRCTDGKMRRPTMFRMFFMISSDGVNIEAYFKNTLVPVCFVDQAFYEANGIKQSDLKMLNVLDSLLIGEEITSGIYEARSRGKQPTWGTTGEFRWKLSLDSIKDVLKYIMGHVGSQDSILKSQIIWQILLKNESKLKGTVLVSGNSGNLRDETCELIKVLRGERHFGWDGKWLYTESLELVSPKAVSKYDISPSIYGKIKSETSLYELLGFKKTEADEVDRIKRGLTSRQLDVLQMALVYEMLFSPEEQTITLEADNREVTSEERRLGYSRLAAELTTDYSLAKRLYDCFAPLEEDRVVLSTYLEYEAQREQVQEEISMIRNGFPFSAVETMNSSEKTADYLAELRLRLRRAQEDREELEKQISELTEVRSGGE